MEDLYAQSYVVIILQHYPFLVLTIPSTFQELSYSRFLYENNEHGRTMERGGLISTGKSDRRAMTRTFIFSWSTMSRPSVRDREYLSSEVSTACRSPRDAAARCRKQSSNRDRSDPFGCDGFPTRRAVGSSFVARQKLEHPDHDDLGPWRDVDRIVALEMGADDYLGKPFHLRELLARSRA